MRKASLALLALIALPGAAFAESNGNVVKALRPQLRTFDAEGAPLGQIQSKDLKLPAPIVGYGKGNSVGVKHGGAVVYLRGLDVQTDGKAACAPVQSSARAKGSAYAATNMGLGGGCERPQ